MATPEYMDLQAYRAKYPAYAAWSDKDLRNALVKKHIAENPDTFKYQKHFPDAIKVIHGLGRGVLDVGEGFGQAALTLGDKVGLVPHSFLEDYNENVLGRRALYEQSPTGQSFAGTIGRTGGNIAPYLLIPGGAPAGLLRKGAYYAGTGAATGATQFVGPEDSRAVNTLLGGALGFGIPSVIKAVKSGGEVLQEIAEPFISKSKKFIAERIMRGVSPKSLKGLPQDLREKTIDDIVERKQAGERLGLNLRPSEASGSEYAAAAEGKLGTTNAGAQKMFEFNKIQADKRKQAIDDLLDETSLSNAPAGTEARDIARGIINKKVEKMKEKAAPLYEKAYEAPIPEKTFVEFLDDPIIRKTMLEVTKDPVSQKVIYEGKDKALKALRQKTGGSLKSPSYVAEGDDVKINVPQRMEQLKNLYQKKIDRLLKRDDTEGAANLSLEMREIIEEFGDSSYRNIRFFDLVKRRMDDKIESALRTGNKNEARILTETKNEMLSKLDSSSKYYKAARKIYTDDSTALNKLKKSELGKIANFEDINTKRVGRTIFDPTETDISRLQQSRDAIVAEDKAVWGRIVRNELERKLANNKSYRIGKHASGFYNAVLSNPNDYNRFREALKPFPKALQRFEDMKKAFEFVIDRETTKGAAGKAKSSLDVPRSSVQAARNYLDEMLGGKMDDAAIELVTSGKWDKLYEPIRNMKDGPEKFNKIANALRIIAVERATSPEDE